MNLSLERILYEANSITSHQGGSWEVSLATGAEVSLASGTTIAVTQSGSWEVSLASGASVLAVQSGSWEVSLASGSTVIVTATDLDIRDLSSSTDSVLAVEAALNTAIKSSVVAVTDTAAALPATSLTARKRVQIQNVGTNVLYLGASDVTDVNGIVLNRGATQSLERGTQAIYGICESGKTSSVKVLEIA